MLAWGQIIITTLIALFPIVDPVGAIPTFIIITEGNTPEHRRQQLTRACLYVFVMLAMFLIAGNVIMRFFGISIPGIRIAGGIILFRIALDMLKAQPKYTQSQAERSESVHKEDVSFTPLAMPLLSGPAAIAVTLGLTSLADHYYDYLAILIGILLVTVSAWLILHASGKVTGFLGVTGMNIVERMMGFLLLCMSIQFIINAILNIMTDENLLHKLSSIFNT